MGLDYQLLERRFWVGFLLGIFTGTIGVLAIQGLIGDLTILLPTLGTLMFALSVLAAMATAVMNGNVPRAIWMLLIIGGILMFSGRYILPRINTPPESNPTPKETQNYYRSMCAPQMQLVPMLTWDSYGEKPVQSIPCNATNILDLKKSPLNRNGRTLLFVEYQGAQGWVDSQYLSK